MQMAGGRRRSGQWEPLGAELGRAGQVGQQLVGRLEANNNGCQLIWLVEHLLCSLLAVPHTVCNTQALSWLLLAALGRSSSPRRPVINQIGPTGSARLSGAQFCFGRSLGVALQTTQLARELCRIVSCTGRVGRPSVQCAVCAVCAHWSNTKRALSSEQCAQVSNAEA